MSGGGGEHVEETVKSAVPLVDLAAVEKALRGSVDELRAALKKVRPADVGRELARLSFEDAKRLVEALDDRRASAMLRAAHPSVAGKLLAKIDPGLAVKLLLFQPIDVQASILGGLSQGERERIEMTFPTTDREHVNRVLAYTATSVGRLMTPKVWKVEKTATAGQAMAALRDKANDIEVAANCYVVEGDKLVGVAPLRELAVAAPDASVHDMMVHDVIAVSEETEGGDAAEIITTHNFLSLPVIDKAGRLVGAVTVDDLLDSAMHKVGAGLLNQGGVAGKVIAAAPYFQNSLARVVRSRLTWLVLLFVAETATGTVLRHFEVALAKWVQLAFFIPLLIGTGGNAGSQTVSTVIRALALGEVRMRDLLRVVGKEVTAGLILGLLLGAIAFGRARMWGCDNYIATCVAVTILVVCTWANCVGAAIPIGAQRVGVDPTVVSGPLITTLVDASGLFIYLTIAVALLSSRPMPRSEMVGEWTVQAPAASTLRLNEDGTYELDGKKGRWDRDKGGELVLDAGTDGKFKYAVGLEGKEGQAPEAMTLGLGEKMAPATLVRKSKEAPPELGPGPIQRILRGGR